MTAHIVTEDVNTALYGAAFNLKLYGEKRETRNGLALVMRGVHTTVFQSPKHRVLFHPGRDANPFFHLMEALWMFAGRNDVAFPTIFNKSFGEYSDDGIRFSGAYGYRWRKWFEIDQIAAAIHTLAADPGSRRTVVQMYDARNDIQIAERGGKDIPCNLGLTLQIWDDTANGGSKVLDMVVFNRSNDLIWGAYGSNVVHFSMLQQLIAEALGVEVGEYAQVSANTHVYERHWTLLDQLAEARDYVSPYESTVVSTNLLLQNNTFSEGYEQFLADCSDLCDRATVGPMAPNTRSYQTMFFNRIVCPIMDSWLEFKDTTREGRATRAIAALAALPPKLDWRLACEEWLVRRGG